MTHSRRTLIGSVLALLAGLALCLWLGLQDVPQQLQRLPDGSAVRLIGVTYPEKPEIQTGPAFLRFAAPIMPATFREQLGLTTWPPFRGIGSNPDPLTVWTRFSDNASPDSAVARMNGVVRIWDENGNCAVSRLGALYHYDYSPVFPIYLDSFPRRGKQLRLELFGEEETDRLQHLATFRLSNPLYRTYPVWVPAALPNRQRDGAFTATLLELKTGLPNPDSPTEHRGEEHLNSGDWVYTRMVLTLHYQGRPTEDWAATMVTIQDATGNDITTDVLEDERTPQRLVIRFAMNLWKEPAWKVMLTFSNGSQRREATFQVRPTIH